MLAPGARIGILGGGQLGRMLATAAAELGFDVHIFTPEQDSPAGRVAAACTIAPYEDESSLERFAAGVDVVTFEFENVPVSALQVCARHTQVRPGARSLELTQDRLIEKQFVESLGLLAAPFRPVSTAAELDVAIAALGLPAILKTRRMGYDGKGQAKITAAADAAVALAAMQSAPAVLEGFVAFSCEVSVILARGTDGAIEPFTVTQNTHRDGILRESLAPAPIPAMVAAQAVEEATAIAAALDHVGVLAVEFFVEAEGGLRVNEIAPRVHNSGHWTQDAGGVSQFTQHIRAVVGWPLARPESPPSPVQMINIIGDDATYWRNFAVQPAVRLHLYGKREVRDGRKMGHATIMDSSTDTN
jgi:5-(carboxyamino)imidazole ribonucleotide synthase